jgi:hypothetical protein
MGALILCSFCRRKLTAVRYRYCTRPVPPHTEHKRLGECCNTPALRSELKATGWTVGEQWVKGGGTLAGALGMGAGTSQRSTT